MRFVHARPRSNRYADRVRRKRGASAGIAFASLDALEVSMRVAEIMTMSVQTVPSSMAVADAWELMRRRRIHHLVVVDGSSVIGVLSDRDIGGEPDSVRSQARVSDVMTRRVVTTAPEVPVRKIANLMRGRTIGCVPVMREGRLAGIVTVSDLLQLVGRGFDRPARPSRRTLNYRTPHGKAKGKRAFGVW